MNRRHRCLDKNFHVQDKPKAGGKKEEAKKKSSKSSVTYC
jgi:hypothetical protein